MRGGDASAHDDALLSRLYRQIAEVQEPYFAAGYDLQTGMDRYRAWLGEQTEAAPSVSATDVTMPLRAVVTGQDKLGAVVTGPDKLGAVVAGPDQWTAELAVIELYSMQYKALVRLAAMLVRDTSTAEEVVQDSFIAMHDGWHRLKDADKALAYLRQAVVNRSRSVLRHRIVVEKNAPKPAPDMPSAEHGAMALLERSAVIAALRDLPERQREAIVLRYYADLSEAEIAAAMRITRGAVKSHTARGMATLRAALEQVAG
jgi:RNA polymerase sigma-70 factor (sigma-E family)